MLEKQDKEISPLLVYTDETVTFFTYQENDNLDPFGKMFTVQTNWARVKVAELFNKSLERFLVEYTWDDTMGWELEAKREGVLISLSLGNVEGYELNKF